MTNTVNIPTNMLPEDGRFGSGPSKIRPEQVQRSTRARAIFWAPRTARPRSSRWSAPSAKACRISSRFPTADEVVLGNGGASAFWDIACASLITRRRRSARTAPSARNSPSPRNPAPFLEDPEIFAGKPGTYRLPELTEYVDAYCWAHNETSTGVAVPVKRVEGSKEQGALTLIDATSGAGALNVDISQTDAYYFSPAEGVRLRRRPVDRRAFPGCDRPRLRHR